MLCWTALISHGSKASRPTSLLDFCMILTRLMFVSACAALAPSKHEQQAVAAGNSSNSFSSKRTWQDAPNEDSKHASPDTER